MFVTLMCSAAFVEADPERIVRIGLSQIPDTCRLTADIEQAMDIACGSRNEVELE